MTAACDVIYEIRLPWKTFVVTLNWKYKGSALYLPNIMSIR